MKFTLLVGEVADASFALAAGERGSRTCHAIFDFFFPRWGKGVCYMTALWNWHL